MTSKAVVLPSCYTSLSTNEGATGLQRNMWYRTLCLVLLIIASQGFFLRTPFVHSKRDCQFYFDIGLEPDLCSVTEASRSCNQTLVLAVWQQQWLVHSNGPAVP